jgi:hypothetical protein
MILFNAVWAGVYWEPLLVLPSEQRRVAGRERPSEQQLEVQPGYSAELRVHLLRHRAPIMATPPMDIPVTVIQVTRSRATDTQAARDTPPTPVLRAMDIRASRETPLTPVHRAMDTQATRDSPPTPPRVTDRQATRGTPTPDPRPLRRQATPDSPLTQVVRAMDIRAHRPKQVMGLQLAEHARALSHPIAQDARHRQRCVVVQDRTRHLAEEREGALCPSQNASAVSAG